MRSPSTSSRCAARATPAGSCSSRPTTGATAILPTAENRAAAMGATEISNSFGEPERKVPAKILAAYNHPGIVITASTGDDGWFGWDFANNTATGISQNAARSRRPPRRWSRSAARRSPPTTRPTAPRRSSGTRTAWTTTTGSGGSKQGATGGGCSRIYQAQQWQKHYPGYAAAGCKGMRLAADVAALADPQTGFDILDSYGSGGWITIGGTSLSSPLTAAMYALAGGSGGAAYPASSLYVNAAVHPDVGLRRGARTPTTRATRKGTASAAATAPRQLRQRRARQRSAAHAQPECARRRERRLQLPAQHHRSTVRAAAQFGMQHGARLRRPDRPRYAEQRLRSTSTPTRR